MTRIGFTALALLLTIGNPSWAQFLRPIPLPRPVPVPRPPIHVPHVPVHAPHAQPSQANADSSDDSGLWTGAGSLALLFGGGYLGYRCWKRRTPAARIRITDIPPGDAPDAIRRAWIGLELPLADGQTVSKPIAVVGVLSNGEESTTGYAVSGKTAVELLTAHAPEAADWWRENADHVMTDGYQLVFPEYVCQRID